MKTPIWFISIVLVITLGYYVFHKEEPKIAKEEAAANWFKKYPELGQIAKVESAIIFKDMPKLSESEAKLAGKITNSLGIRDDVLEFIVKSIPESNVMAMKAAIKIARNDQLIYYGNLSSSSAKALDSSDNLALVCLTMALGTNQGIKMNHQIDQLMRNNDARNQHMWAVDRKYFSWQVLGSGMSVADENKACSEGHF